MTANTQRVTFKIRYRFETRRVLLSTVRPIIHTFLPLITVVYRNREIDLAVFIQLQKNTL